MPIELDDVTHEGHLLLVSLSHHIPASKEKATQHPGTLLILLSLPSAPAFFSFYDHSAPASEANRFANSCAPDECPRQLSLIDVAEWARLRVAGKGSAFFVGRHLSFRQPVLAYKHLQPTCHHRPDNIVLGHVGGKNPRLRNKLSAVLLSRGAPWVCWSRQGVNLPPPAPS